MLYSPYAGGEIVFAVYPREGGAPWAVFEYREDAFSFVEENDNLDVDLAVIDVRFIADSRDK